MLKQLTQRHGHHGLRLPEFCLEGSGCAEATEAQSAFRASCQSGAAQSDTRCTASMFLRLSASHTHNCDRPRCSVKPVGFGKGPALIKNENCGLVRSLHFLIVSHTVKPSERSEGRFRRHPVIPLTGKTTQILSFAPSAFHKRLFPEQTAAENKSRAKLRCVLMERQLRGSGETRRRGVSGGRAQTASH